MSAPADITHISATAPDASSTPTHISAPACAVGPIYAIRLQARSGTDGIRALRAALKILWRRYQLRCLDAREVKGQHRSYETMMLPLVLLLMQAPCVAPSSAAVKPANHAATPRIRSQSSR